MSAQALEARWHAKRAEYDERFGKGGHTILFAFHGTSKEAVDSILEQGDARTRDARRPMGDTQCMKPDVRLMTGDTLCVVSAAWCATHRLQALQARQLHGQPRLLWCRRLLLRTEQYLLWLQPMP